MDIDRRNFLKVIGVTAASSLLPACETEVHQLIPYLIPDEEITPGVADWYASICQECDAGCGVIVRVMEGRAKKIEGNPRHPVNQGKLCARGHAALQGLYNPDRIRGPLKRDGKRGNFKPIGWEEGISLWLAALQKEAGKAALISRPLSGSLGNLFGEVMKRISGSLLFYDPTGETAVRKGVRESFGVDQLPHYDLAQTDYLLSFGAPFLEDWISPVYFGVGYGKMRQGRPGVRGRFVQVEPRLSVTAASADRWIPARPGTEGLLAIGIGQAILQGGGPSLTREDRRRFETFYTSFDLDRIAADTEVPKEMILTLAREFSAAEAPLALGGGVASAQTNGLNTLMAINALNLLTGRAASKGGVRFFKSQEDFQSSHLQPQGEEALLALAKEFKNKKRSLLMLYQSNPLFTLPPSLEFRETFENAGFIVSFSSFLDESTEMADLILPDHTPLESWGDHLQEGLLPGAAIGLGQPVVTPLYETRPVGDLFLDALRRLGKQPAEKDFRGVLQSRWKKFLTKRGEAPAGRSFDAAWIEQLQTGFWRAKGARAIPIKVRRPPPTYEAPVFDGDEKEYPFYFYPFPSMGLHDGRGANRPWLQELPDLATTVVWGSWVEINPKTAKEYNLTEGEVVRVISRYGTVEAPVVLYPGARPDMISMPLGQGHTAYGRYAKGRGANPLLLLGPLLDKKSGILASAATRVRIEATGKRGTLVMVDQTGQGTERNPEGKKEKPNGI